MGRLCCELNCKYFKSDISKTNVYFGKKFEKIQCLSQKSLKLTTFQIIKRSKVPKVPFPHMNRMGSVVAELANHPDYIRTMKRQFFGWFLRTLMVAG